MYSNSESKSDVGYFLQGIEKIYINDVKSAVSFFQKGSDHGCPLSKCYLGICYFQELDIERNLTKANEIFEDLDINFLEKNAELGDHWSRLLLAWLYRNGIKVPKDEEKYLELTILAAGNYASPEANASSCNPVAVMNLAHHYMYKDVDIASILDMCDISANLGCVVPAKLLKAKILVEDELFKSPEIAFEIVEELVKNYNSYSAKFELGKYLHYGIGTAVNHEKAFQYFEEVQDHYFLGIYAKEGFLAPSDPIAAFKHFQAGADQNCVDSQFKLGSCYEVGYGVDINFELAIYYFDLAKKGNCQFKKNLDNLYYKIAFDHENNGDLSKALQYYQWSFDAGLIDASSAIERISSKMDALNEKKSNSIELATHSGLPTFGEKRKRVPSPDVDLMPPEKKMRVESQPFKNFSNMAMINAFFENYACDPGMDLLNNILDQAPTEPEIYGIGENEKKEGLGSPNRHLFFRHNVDYIENGLPFECSRYGYLCVNVLGNGNCLFYAFAKQLFLYFGINDTDENTYKLGYFLRQFGCNHIEKYIDFYKYFFFDQENLESFSKDKEFADDIVISALCYALRLDLICIRSDGAKPNIKRHNDALMQVKIGYDLTFLHYQSLIADPEQEKRQAVLQKEVEASPMINLNEQPSDIRSLEHLEKIIRMLTEVKGNSIDDYSKVDLNAIVKQCHVNNTEYHLSC